MSGRADVKEQKAQTFPDVDGRHVVREIDQMSKETGLIHDLSAMIGGYAEHEEKREWRWNMAILSPEPRSYYDPLTNSLLYRDTGLVYLALVDGLWVSTECIALRFEH